MVTGSVNHDSFGNVVGSTGSTNNPYQFAGAWGYRTDGDAGLQHVGARYYDSQVGRFITRDTYLDQKPYAYCDGDPVNGVDPSGHQAEHTKGARKSTEDKHTSPRPGDPEKGDRRRFGPGEKWRKPTPPKPKPEPPKVPDPSPVPPAPSEPAPVGGSGDTSAKITIGVVIGTALYWIISEGTRIIPARNLIPIP